MESTATDVDKGEAKTDASVVKRPSTRFESLDFFRGVAALMVTLFHVAEWANNLPMPARSTPVRVGLAVCVKVLWLGVPIFFVISGYCIAASIRAAQRGPTVQLGQFFRKRFRRIFPPYWVALVLFAAVAVVCAGAGMLTDVVRASDPRELTAWQWLGNITLTERWRHRVIGEASHLVVPPAWSLCYEEQFYAVSGALLLLPKRWFMVGVAGVTAATLAFLPMSLRDPNAWFQGFFFDGRWLMFAMGVLVFYRVNEATPERRRAADVMLLVTTLGCVLVRAVWMRQGDFTSSARFQFTEFLCASAFAGLLCVIHRFDAGFARHRALRPVWWCGTMCYSLYLVHAIVVAVVIGGSYELGINRAWSTMACAAVVAFGVSLFVAWAFHCLVERRFLNTSERSPLAAPSASEARGAV